MTVHYRVERWKEVYSPNPAMLRLLLVREGYEVFQWADRPRAFYGAHKHPEEQSHWIISGNLEIHVKDVGTFQLGPGDRDFMPAETYHTAQVLGDEAVVYLIGIKQLPKILEPVKKSKPKPAAKGPTARVRKAMPKRKPPKKK